MYMDKSYDWRWIKIFFFEQNNFFLITDCTPSIILYVCGLWVTEICIESVT